MQDILVKKNPFKQEKKNWIGRLYEPVLNPKRKDAFKLILNIPQEELDRHKQFIGDRYTRQFIVYAPVAFFKSILPTSFNQVSDKDVSDAYAFSAFGKKLRALLPNEVIAWEAVLPKATSLEDYFVVQYIFPEDVKVYEGCHIANTAAVFKKIDNKNFEVLGIAVDGEQFFPKDGKHWELSKQFLLNCALVFLLSMDHPKIHLPMDAIIGNTIRMLPSTHLIHQILAPHFNFTAAVNNSVLMSEKSPVNTEADHVFHSSPLSFASNLSMIAASKNGMDAADYPVFQYDHQLEYFPTDYHCFLNKYYEVILDFVETIFEAANFEMDVLTIEWAKAIQKDLPGFELDTVIHHLPALLAKIIHNCSVTHSDDHATINNLPHNKICSRIEVAPPKHGKVPYQKVGEIRSRSNYFRQLMANRLFYAPYTLDSMLDLKYPFGLPVLQNIATQFVENLKDAERELEATGVKIYQRLDEMSPSIQF